MCNVTGPLGQVLDQGTDIKESLQLPFYTFAHLTNLLPVDMTKMHIVVRNNNSSLKCLSIFHCRTQ